MGDVRLSQSTYIEFSDMLAYIDLLVIKPRFEVIIDSLIRNGTEQRHIPYTRLLLLPESLGPIRLPISFNFQGNSQLTLATLLVAPPPPPDKRPPAFFPAFFEIACCSAFPANRISQLTMVPIHCLYAVLPLLIGIGIKSSRR
jgi:hypothetical protein